jgi:hypothetical protein
MNAYKDARRIQPGCTHIQGHCKCEAPFWLRESSPEEEAMAERIGWAMSERDDHEG